METEIKGSDTEQDYNASKPSGISMKGWIPVFKRVFKQIQEDNVPIVSAGVAFYFFLALFPAIAAIVSIYGLVVEPAQVEQQMVQMADILPEKTHQLIANIMEQIAGKPQDALGWSLIVSVLFSLWSANKATHAVFVGVNIAYHEKDERGFIKMKALELLFTLGAIITGILSISFVVGFPALIDNLNLPGVLQLVFAILRWLILAAIIYFALAVVYKIAPHRHNPKLKWVTPGSIFATVFWLIGSLLFSFFVNKFGNFDQTYGSIAAIIILMLWFFLTGFIVIMGAEFNSEIEHQTRVDTTVGEDRPMGERGAYYADRVADVNK
jgi:membrane protein